MTHVWHTKVDQRHDFVLGTQEALENRAAPMSTFSNMAHDRPCRAHVPAVKTAGSIRICDRPCDFDFACLIDGRCLAGLVGRIPVSAT